MGGLAFGPRYLELFFYPSCALTPGAMYSHLVLAAWSALLVSAGVVPKGVEVKTGFVSIFDAQSPPPAPKWNCEVRAWTRAPDLSPNAAVPAEARLALNGSACTDIIGWKAGLRFKERAIVKLKSVAAVYPKNRCR